MSKMFPKINFYFYCNVTTYNSQPKLGISLVNPLQHILFLLIKIIIHVKRALRICLVDCNRHCNVIYSYGLVIL